MVLPRHIQRYSTPNGITDDEYSKKLKEKENWPKPMDSNSGPMLTLIIGFTLKKQGLSINRKRANFFARPKILVQPTTIKTSEIEK